VASDVNITKQLLEFISIEIEDFTKFKRIAEQYGNDVDYEYNSGVVAGLELVKDWLEV